MSSPSAGFHPRIERSSRNVMTGRWLAVRCAVSSPGTMRCKLCPGRSQTGALALRSFAILKLAASAIRTRLFLGLHGLHGKRKRLFPCKQPYHKATAQKLLTSVHRHSPSSLTTIFAIIHDFTIIHNQ